MPVEKYQAEKKALEKEQGELRSMVRSKNIPAEKKQEIRNKLNSISNRISSINLDISAAKSKAKKSAEEKREKKKPKPLIKAKPEEKKDTSETGLLQVAKEGTSYNKYRENAYTSGRKPMTKPAWVKAGRPSK